MEREATEVAEMDKPVAARSQVEGTQASLSFQSAQLQDSELSFEARATGLRSVTIEEEA